MPTPADNKKEASEFINVVNRGTTKVGFAVRGPMVIGHYCPPASTVAAELIKSVPTVRVLPVPPKAPEGVALLSTLDGPCPVLSGAGTEEDPEVRARCSDTLCCGESLLGDKSFSSCRDSSKTEFVDTDGTYTFKCYLEDARRLVMSFTAIGIFAAFSI